VALPDHWRHQGLRVHSDPVSGKKCDGGNGEEGIRGRELGDIGLRGG
jgi:hypothetical protein